MRKKTMDIDNVTTLVVGGAIVAAAAGAAIVTSVKKRSSRKEDLTIDKIKNSYSTLCDDMIFAEINKTEKKLRYVSGYFNLTLRDSLDKVKVDVELYFQDDKENWIKKSSSENLGLEQFTEEAKKDLIETKHIQFEVDPPESLKND